MDPDVLKLAQLFVVIGMFTAAMTVVGAIAKRMFAAPRPPKPREQGLLVDEARFSRLEDAVETIAVEVERIAEAQRFSARLLAERARESAAEPKVPAHVRQDPPSRS